MLLTAAFCLWAQLPPVQEIPPRQVFGEARTAWREEGGQTWGVSLAGPLLLVDPKTRQAWATEPDKDGCLKDSGDGVFAGAYPEGRIVANTTVTWAGKDWVMLALPLPTDQRERKVLLLHESWHRVQRGLNLFMPEAFNAHLDTLEGRYWLQVEWRALARALAANGEEERQVSVSYAVAARTFRQNLFPNAADNEKSLLLQEGLAEYTGVRAAGAKDTVIKELRRARPPYSRTFAYLSGPAYGLLLDDVSPGWPLHVNRGTDISVLLQEAYQIPAPTERDARRAAERLGGAELRKREEAEEKRRQQHIELIKTLFVQGPHLKIPPGFRLQFNPSNTENIEGVGAYHPTATYMGDWGVLEVTDGSLRAQDWSEARVIAPVTMGGRDHRGSRSSAPRRVTGPGWSLELAPGWSIVQSGAGVWVLARDMKETDR